MRRLIINADDFGLTAGVNRGIAECVRQGVVTSVTLMANVPAFSDAVDTLRRMSSGNGNSSPSVGCHTVLVDGVPVTPAERIRSLLPEQASEFRPGLRAFALAAATGRLHPDEIALETEAQIRTIQAAGVRLSHLDAHKHAHLFPAVLPPLLRAARSCGIRAVRNPFAPIRPLAFAHLLRRPHLWKTYTEVKLLRGWLQRFRSAVADAGMVTPDGTFGIVSTGALDLELFRAIAGCIPEGTWEFCCHPGYNDSDLSRVRTRLRDSRDREREVLTSDAARAVLRENGIELISYWELQ